MVPTLIAIAVIVVLIILFVIGSFNRFVSQKQLIKDAWSNIDTELRRRYDLIPNLVESVKGYASHEKEVFEEVTKARAMASGATGSPAAQAAAEGPLVAALGRLMLVAEAYPDLKANQNFLALQSELSNTEDRLQTARRFYNSNVRDYNRRVQSFPSSIIANAKGFKTEEYFEVDEALRGDAGVPKVNFAGEGPAVSFGGAAAPSVPAVGTSTDPAAPAQGGGGTPPPPPAQ
ncbi:MAG: LemA protein [Actinomycetota bacterium]|jgi:LemA protein|nr:LemA protein [Actinomycetota bacterium]